MFSSCCQRCKVSSIVALTRNAIDQLHIPSLKKQLQYGYSQLQLSTKRENQGDVFIVEAMLIQYDIFFVSNRKVIVEWSKRVFKMKPINRKASNYCVVWEHCSILSYDGRTTHVRGSNAPQLINKFPNETYMKTPMFNNVNHVQQLYGCHLPPKKRTIDSLGLLVLCGFFFSFLGCESDSLSLLRWKIMCICQILSRK